MRSITEDGLPVEPSQFPVTKGPFCRGDADFLGLASLPGSDLGY